MVEGTTSGVDVQIRELQPSERDAYFDFLRRCLVAADRVISIHEWRRRSEPVSGGVRTLLALHGGRIVGAQSTGAADFTCAGQVIRGAYHLDTIVDESMRGRGLGKRLTLETAAPWPITMAKGTQAAMYALRKRIGFMDVPNSTILARSLALRSPLTSRAVAIHVASLTRSILFRRRLRRSAGLRVTPMKTFGAEFDALESRARAASVFRAAKPGAYLDWRYTTCPVRSYELYRVDGEEGLRGALVLRLPPTNPAEPRADAQAWVVDMIVEPGDRQASRALLGHALDVAASTGAIGVRAFATGVAARAALGEQGFIDTRHSPRFTYIRGEGAPNLPWQRLAWDFQHGDADNEFYS